MFWKYFGKNLGFELVLRNYVLLKINGRFYVVTPFPALYTTKPIIESFQIKQHVNKSYLYSRISYSKLFYKDLAESYTLMPGPPWSATLSIAPLIFLMRNPYSLFRLEVPSVLQKPSQ